MQLSIPKRALVRVVSYTAALLVVTGGAAWRGHTDARDYQTQLTSGYERSLGELSGYLTNIAIDLQKGQYVGTAAQLTHLSARIWRESGSAKAALSTLPTGELRMDATYKFLSQVGDYAMLLSKKMTAGGTLSDEEQDNARALCRYAARLRDYMDSVQQQLHDGRISLSPTRAGGAENAPPTDIEGGFEDVEQTMTGYPTLIYDGPFSDHLLRRRPRLTQGLPAVTPEQAAQSAARAARVSAESLTRADDENSNMPLFTFQSGDSAVGVTKAGGLPVYLINAREIGEERLSHNAVLENSAGYLGSLGIKDMRATYYETADGICTINYAATDGETTLYTDLIKVGVALDDGGIVFYDARGYIANHYERTLPASMLSVAEAQRSLNPSLVVRSTRLALIPTSGGAEVLAREFRAKAKDGQNLLVYVNAATGAEEQILILLESPTGTLTK